MSIIDKLDLRGRRRTPIIRQTEASECGLACIAMIASFHGLESDMSTFRRHFDISLKGATLKYILQIASNVGLASRPLKIDLERLPELKLPALLHWNLNHFVVLTAIRDTFKGRRYDINDPAHGLLTVTQSRMSSGFTGVAVEMAPAVNFRPQTARSPLRISQLWSGVRGPIGVFSTILLLSLILQIASLVAPFYLQIGVDEVIPASDAQFLLMLTIGFGGLAIITVLTDLLRSLSIISITNSFAAQMIDNLFGHLIKLPVGWFERRHVGDIVSRFNSIQPISDFMTQSVVSSLLDGILAVATFIMLYIYSPMLSLIAFCATLAYISVKIASFSILRSANVNSITASARESSSFIETVRGISTLKAFGKETNRQRWWQNLKAASVNAQLKIGRLSAYFNAASQAVLSGERIAFVFFAVTLVIKGRMSIGMIFAAQAYKQQFLDAATRLVDQGLRYRLVDVHLARLSDIVFSRTEPVVRLAGDQEIVGRIELRNVSYRYGSAEPFVLHNVNLKVDAGSVVALVGPSGSGKTTLLKIMMGLIQPTVGDVLIDGLPIEQIGLQHWRSVTGSVLQADGLFAGTLAENVAFFDPHIDMGRVKEVCEQAGIIEEIEAMPLRWETLVGDMGSSLSGGQQQRVMLARALYSKPTALFMDEGTANLDDATEARVIEALSELTATRILSAHRWRSIQIASRVLVVRDGLVAEVAKEQLFGKLG